MTSRPNCRLLLACFALAGAGAGAAEDKAGPETPAASDREDPLIRAQRDYAAIKSAREGTLVPGRSELPRLDTPGFQPSPPVAAPRVTNSTAPVDRSSNWLVEAMKRDAPGREVRRGSGEQAKEKDPELQRPNFERDGRGPEHGGTENPASPERRAASAGAFNPLEPFMGAWMTPRDYALLKPPVESSIGGGLGGRREGQDRVREPTSPVGIMSALADPRGRQPAAPLAVSPLGAVRQDKENPFLAPLASSSPPAPSGARPGVVVPTPPRAVEPADKAPSVVGPGPDFAKPSDNDKYFKQLKRF